MVSANVACLVRATFVFGLLVLGLASACSQEPASVVAREGLPHRRIAGTRVELSAPRGFEPSEAVHGIARADARAKLGVFELPAPFAETAPDPTQWNDAELRLVRWEAARVAGNEARLYHLERERDGVATKSWMVVCGDATESLLMVAECDAELAAELEQPLRECLLGAKWERESVPQLAFELTPGADLVLVRDDGTAHVYAPTGTPSPLPEGTPFLLVTQVPRSAAEGLEAACRERLDGALATVGAQIVALESSKEVASAGRRGWELVASVDGGRLAWITLVPAGAGALVLQGQCPLARREPYLAAFRAAAASLTLK
ncbi:MAG: hypothetical protein NTV21_14290 [Planctomycetota bacterium]|nr:hypothetical protein [Planctomycetota bacterium]